MSSSIAMVTEIAVAVVQHEGRYLIGLRPPEVPLGGLWEFPGGKVQTGETAQQAAARECREETGLVVVIGEAFPDVLHTYDHGQLRLHFFLCRLLDASKEDPTPERFRWVSGEKLVDYEFPAANAELIQYLSTQK